jgi:hypothetical protein
MTEVSPNPNDFSRNEREREYTAIIYVRGRISVNVKADSAEDARRQAEAEIESLEKEGYVEIDDVDQIELSRVYKDPPMYRVIREGKTMQVSRLQPGDAPRSADERGF